MAFHLSVMAKHYRYGFLLVMALIDALIGQDHQQIACCDAMDFLDGAAVLIVGEDFPYSIDYLGASLLLCLLSLIMANQCVRSHHWPPLLPFTQLLLRSCFTHRSFFFRFVACCRCVFFSCWITPIFCRTSAYSLSAFFFNLFGSVSGDNR